MLAILRSLKSQVKTDPVPLLVGGNKEGFKRFSGVKFLLNYNRHASDA